MHVNPTKQEPEQGPTRALTALFRSAAAALVVIAGIMSLALQLYQARTNEHYYMTVLFALWVSSPFVAMIWLWKYSDKWITQSRLVAFLDMILISMLSMAVYINNLLNPRMAQPAFVFVVVPAISWIFIGVMVLVAVYLTRKRGV